MDLLKLVDELDDQITKAPAVPLTPQVRVDRTKMYELLDGLREVIPVEIGEARALLTERDTLLDAARTRADELVGEATQRAAELVGEATQRADELLGEATQRADGVLEQATQRAEAIVAEAQAASESTTGAQLQALDTRVGQLAAAVGELREAEVPSALTPLTGAMQERLRPILESAERAAHELRQEALREAVRITDEARREAVAIREEAATDISSYLAQVESETAEMLDRGRAVLSRQDGLDGVRAGERALP